MSRRKQSHPRAWKDPTDSIKPTGHPEDLDHTQGDSVGTIEEAGILGRTDPEQQSSSQFLEALLKAQVGQTLGPISASICPAAEVPQVQGKEGLHQLLKMVLEAPENTIETLEFSSVREDDHPHLEITERGEGVYMKLLRTIEAGTRIQGLVLHPLREESDGKKIKQEPPENNFRACSSARGSPTMGECLAARGSPTADGSPTAGGSPTARGSPTTRRSPTARASPGTRGSLQSQMDMTPTGEEEIPDVTTKKCPNCSVCFRNSSNLEAHQLYYCTGRDRTNPAPIKRDTNGTLLTSQITGRKVSPRNPSRSPSPVHVCQLCQSSFMSRQNCESHMLILHCSEQVPMCKFCNFVARSWEVLREHVFTHVRMERQGRGEGDDERCRLPGDVAESINAVRNCSPQASIMSKVEKEAVSESNVGYLRGRNGEVEGRGSRSPTDSRQPNIPHPNCLSKRKLNDSNDIEAKRVRLLDRPSSTSSAEVAPDPLIQPPMSNPSGYSPAAYMCRSCSICFRSKENFMAHKRYYCKQRLTEADPRRSNPSSREGSPDCSPQTTVAPERMRAGQSRIPLGNIDGTSPDRPECRRLPKPCHAPMMYMGPVVPSAMLVGGTQHITPSGAHVISPIFLLTPPVAIPMTRAEPPHSSPHSSNVIRKSRPKGDVPLDLSFRPSPEGHRSPPAVKTEPSETTPPEEAHTSPKSPKKAFTCVQCGTHFQKASTLMAHEQLYCSELSRNKGLPPPLRQVHSLGHGRSIRTGLPHSSVATVSDILASGDNSSLEHHKKSLIGDSKGPGTKLKHSEYHRNGPLCNVNDYLEKIYARNCPEKQILDGLRVCSGCGVAFRKLESLKVHQQFYCQKANSMNPELEFASVYRGPSTSTSHSPPMGQAPREVIHGPAREEPKGNGFGRGEQDYVREGFMQHPEESETRDALSEGDWSNPNSEKTQTDKQLPCSEQQVGSELDGQRRVDAPTRIGGQESLNERKVNDEQEVIDGRERIGEQKTLDGKERIGEQERTVLTTERVSPNHEETILTTERVSSHPEHQQRKQLSPAGSNTPNRGSQTSSPVPRISDTGIVVKVEGSTLEHECSNLDSGQVPRQSPPTCIRIKMEPPSPTSLDNSHPSDLLRKSQPFVNVKLASPITASSSSAPSSRPTPSAFPPGSKVCKSCNISFRSLSTFIAHKNFYCSSTTSLRSNVAS